MPEWARSLSNVTLHVTRRFCSDTPNQSPLGGSSPMISRISRTAGAITLPWHLLCTSRFPRREDVPSKGVSILTPGWLAPGRYYHGSNRVSWIRTHAWRSDPASAWECRGHVDGQPAKRSACGGMAMNRFAVQQLTITFLLATVVLLGMTTPAFAQCCSSANIFETG